MPRAPRMFVDGATYHVHCRVGHGEPVFSDGRAVAELLVVLRELARRDELKILAWCVLPDRYHLALRSGRVPLWRTMRLLQGRFTRAHNRRTGASGPLWEGRYRSRLVAAGEHLRMLVAYVHVAPVAAGLATEAGAYPWSGHRELVAGEGAALVDGEAALAVFGAHPAAARRSYAAAVAAASGAAWASGPPGRLPWWSADRRRRSRFPAVRSSVSSSDFFEAATRATGASEATLRSRRRDAGLTGTRELLALVGAELLGLRVRDLAAGFGRHAGSVSRWIAAAAERRSRDADYRHAADELATLIGETARSLRAARSGFIFES